MRSLLKFMVYALIIIFIPSFIMMFVTSMGFDNIYLVLLGQILIFIILMGSYFLTRKNIVKYENETLKLIEHEDNIEKLKDLREKRISYKSKANISKKIIDLSYSKEELSKLRKYSSTYDDWIFYYASLIKNERDDREIYKKKRDNFIKRYKNRHFIFLDYAENMRTSIKWIIIFLIFSLISYLNPYKFIRNPNLYTMALLLNFTLNFGLMVNTVIWIIRSLKSYWARKII
ncbi:hypothetical protein [Anaerococcus hydrogenalis]|uniref:Uncharacterized protein n=1 Tax=Anaerococcus hydrogenalis TaxID=33029 RepID=A0A2N6UHX0_9FIRM|nr:hypothetical protein [Anaerococcus hydrogenalis]MDK7695335.1 hypothetical protein [Anaerococcus hydrogenalis]MDK7697094.1 hypothetical protein [Anaerococcus hydrogenalis]MDK7708385.1 hypothetical protein [Anaerococcus hydrogenalis]PMC81209.1 hypothetical protein CJ192_06745 [Anaerococcus hydrogenalis]